jgi:D-alanyl-D-alanine carboxypeptidase
MFEQNIGGTSANLQKGEIYSIWQLLHGLMLPSGNDASLAIAVWGGKVLLQN